MRRMILGGAVCVVAAVTGTWELALPGFALYAWGFVADTRRPHVG